MKKYLIFIFILLAGIQANALTLTHPENQDMTVDEDGIFFTGKIERNEKVYINDVLMTPSKSRAFSYSVPLKKGENIFAVQKKDWFGNIETIKYTIKRANNRQAKYQNEFRESQPAYYETIKNNAILRETPIDKGINRLGYLPKGTKLFIDGVQNEFSRVYLSNEKYGWIMTKDVKQIPIELCRPPQKEVTSEDSQNEYGNEETEADDEEEKYEYIPKFIISEQIKKGDEKGITVTLSENAPYSALVDNNKLIVTIYNLNTSSETYTKEFNLGKFPRYSVIMRDKVLDVTFKKIPVTKTSYSNKDVKIVIDAGHGGREIGAVGSLGHKEKNINLEVSNKLKRILEVHKFDVYTTRDTDKYVSLDDRVKFAKEKDAFIYISIHMNSVPISSNPNLNEGSIVFYYNPACKILAQSIVKVLSSELQTKNGGAAQASLAVIRPSEYLGVLVELAYLVNPNDASIYKSKRFTHASAVAIYKGLINYLHSAL